MAAASISAAGMSATGRRAAPGDRRRGHLQPAGPADRGAVRGAGAEPGPGRRARDRQRLDRWQHRDGPRALPVRAARHRAAQHRRRGRVRLRPGPGPGRRGRPGLADGRRHGPRAGRPAGHARRPGASPRHTARADRQPGGVDGRPSASDEHPADQAVCEQRGARGGGHRGLPAHPLSLVRVDPRGCRPVPGPGPAPGRLLPVERRLRVHRPAAARPGRPALPGQRRSAQDGDVRLDRRGSRPAVLLRGAEQDLDAAGRLLAGPRRAGAVRRRHAAPLGPHVREVRRPRHAPVLPPVGSGRRGPDQPAAHRGGTGVSGPEGAR